MVQSLLFGQFGLEVWENTVFLICGKPFRTLMQWSTVQSVPLPVDRHTVGLDRCVGKCGNDYSGGLVKLDGFFPDASE